jgi:hypothetical protein
MNYVRKNASKVFFSIAAIIIVTVIGIWQFYLFVTFTNPEGNVNLQGGRGHLWWAILMAVFAFIAAFFVFSAFLHRDSADELHITS